MRSPLMALMYDSITIPSVFSVMIFFFLFVLVFYFCICFFFFIGRPYCVIETKRIFRFRKRISSKGAG